MVSNCCSDLANVDRVRVVRAVDDLLASFCKSRLSNVDAITFIDIVILEGKLETLGFGRRQQCEHMADLGCDKTSGKPTSDADPANFLEVRL
jgi:hypothetical protein